MLKEWGVKNQGIRAEDAGMFPWESPEFVFPFLWLTWGRFSIQSWRLSLHILSSAQAVEIRSFPLVFHLQMDFGAAGVGEQLPPPSVGELRGVPEGVRASEGPFPRAGTEPKLWILPAGIAPGAGLDGPALPLPRCHPHIPDGIRHSLPSEGLAAPGLCSPGNFPFPDSFFVWFSSGVRPGEMRLPEGDEHTLLRHSQPRRALPWGIWQERGG